ncbi:transglutaminase-like domain-containing protein [Luteimicrobium subarcticum]|uniref:Transglutaminase superfamily protein n=1 Tax=Luteimicrobium subarcticum TaxID=620910 RepID=A0A2M8WR58_9MICO|nr:transglutaminase family protein [Luteimicrobium subarcticum]PJI93398.1 transglutaminase superfamily protein [Luteimicrobium subarcticum]
MLRTVSASLSLRVAAPATSALQIAVADGTHRRREQLTVTANGVEIEPKELPAPHGGRMHHLTLPAGDVEIEYRAIVHGEDTRQRIHEHDLMTYLRPSRYAESDALFGLARKEFSGHSGLELANAVRDWVAAHLSYRPGSTRGTDSARDALGRGRGVCRDFAHLTVAFLRAMDVPARVTAAYAPGLSPMDFHAVAEAFVDDQWHVLDATGLAHRGTLLRITTGRDTSDTAFLSSYGAAVNLTRMTVEAKVDTELPEDDHTAPVVMR